MSGAGGPTAPAPFTSAHDVAAFMSGVPALDEWLRRRGLRNEIEGASRTFVTCAGGRVIGYYSLAAASVLHAVATSRVRRNMPDPVPAILLGRLAIDLAWQGKGLGADLLADATLRVLAAAEIVGVRVLLVHALSDAAAAFYEAHGFRPSPLDPLTLMIAMDEARRSLA